MAAQTPPPNPGIGPSLTIPSLKPSIPSIPDPSSVVASEAPKVTQGSPPTSPLSPPPPATTHALPQQSSPLPPPSLPSSPTASFIESTAGSPPVPAATQASSIPPDRGATTVTLAPTATSKVIVTITNTSYPPEATTSLPTTTSATPASTSASQSGESATPGGLGLTKTVVAIAVPLVSVALIIIGFIIWWGNRKRTAKRSAAVGSSGSEYGFGAGPTALGKRLARGSSSDHSDDPDEITSIGRGYRGWGSTGGGVKTSSIPLSSVGKPVSDGGHSGAVVTSPYVGASGNAGSSSPTGTDSSTVGVISGPPGISNSGGLNRGISNASSNYSAVTTSDQSDLGNNGNSGYYGRDENYFDYSTGANPYDQETPNSPIIQDVQARRHTRVETPTDMHHAQQGSGGIAQNF